MDAARRCRFSVREFDGCEALEVVMKAVPKSWSIRLVCDVCILYSFFNFECFTRFII